MSEPWRLHLDPGHIFNHSSGQKSLDVKYQVYILYMPDTAPGHSQILSRSCGEKLREGLESKLRHGLEMVDSVSTN